jgi:hypothetical protein
MDVHPKLSSSSNIVTASASSDTIAKTTIPLRDTSTTDSELQSSTQPAPNRCYLLELPAELRLRIYEYVFAGALKPLGGGVLKSPFWIPLMDRPWLDANCVIPWTLHPDDALLSTCRQVHKEAHSIPYQQLDFVIQIRPKIEQDRPHRSAQSNRGAAKAEYLLPLMGYVRLEFIEVDIETASRRMQQMCELFVNYKCRARVSKVMVMNSKECPSESHSNFAEHLSKDVTRLTANLEDGNSAKETLSDVRRHLDILAEAKLSRQLVFFSSSV